MAAVWVAGWAGKGVAQPLHRFDAPVEQTWLNSQSAELNLGRVLVRDGQAGAALRVYRCHSAACQHFLLVRDTRRRSLDVLSGAVENLLVSGLHLELEHCEVTRALPM